MGQSVARRCILTTDQFEGKIKIIGNGSEAETPLATHPGIKK